MALTVLIAIILLASNFTIIRAQPIQQQVTSQGGEIESGTTTIPPGAAVSTTTFQSIDDSFRVEVPSGWIIQDVDNTGSSSLSEETAQGYGMLAHLCSVEQQQQGAATVLPNATGGGGSTNTISSINASRCLGAQDVIHILRYPDLETRIQPANNITTYYLQKLEEVGYGGIQTLNSVDTTVNITDPQTNQTIATVPAKFAEITYSTNVAPDEISKGYFILTATNLTAPDIGTTKGYSVFYEVGSATAEAEITRTLPAAVEEVFSSFELIAAPEVVTEQTIVQTEQTTQAGGFGQVIQSECSPSYPGVCIPPPPPDLNCDDIGVSNFTVLSADPHGFDGNDNDGIGCDLLGDPGDVIGDGDSSGDVDDGGGDNSCHPSYPDVCIPPPPPDLNCGDEGVPENFEVSGSDPHGFDGDNDGIGCESESDAPDEPGDDADDDNGGENGDGDDGGGEEPEPEPEPEPGDGGDGGEGGEPEPEPGDGGEGGGDEPT
jgi:hypothetical protein